MKPFRLEITAFDENTGDEVDVEEAILDLADNDHVTIRHYNCEWAANNFRLEILLQAFGEVDVGDAVTIKGEDEVWNKGTDEECTVEPPMYTFYLHHYPMREA